MKYVVLSKHRFIGSEGSVTKWEYFDDLKEAAEYAAQKSGVLLRAVEYTVTEVEESEPDDAIQR